jgi:DNA-binding NarL/FixJ family response regulator
VIWVKESVRVTHDVDGSASSWWFARISVSASSSKRRCRASGKSWSARRSAPSPGEPYNLSFREVTVLHLVTGGRSDKEIGVILGIRPQTVSKHVANVSGRCRHRRAGNRYPRLREGLIA